MAFVLEYAFLPATLSCPPITDDEFVALGQEHEDLAFETTADGELEVMLADFPFKGAQNAGIICQLYLWAEQERHGSVFGSSAFFLLPNGARRSPDASWILNSRIQQLGAANLKKSWRLCPDFVIELLSSSDRLHHLQAKMREYINNGAQLGWLIDPEQRSVTIYRPNQQPETLSEVNFVSGEGPVDGFILQLAGVWDPFNDLSVN